MREYPATIASPKVVRIRHVSRCAGNSTGCDIFDELKFRGLQFYPVP